MPSPRHSRSFLFAAIALLVIAGCAAPLEPTNRSAMPANGNESGATQGVALPGDIPRRDLYPLTVGNRWVYDRRDVNQIIPIAGPPSPPDVHSTPFVITMPCAFNFDGLDYIVQLESFPDLNSHYFYLYRQDADGLFGRDIGGGEVPCPDVQMAMHSTPTKPRVGGGVLAGITDPVKRAAYATALMRTRERMELLRRVTVGAGQRHFTFLEYPLYTGSEWVAKEDGHFTRTVEGPDVITVPAGTFPALRIRLDSDFLGPTDQAFVWYGQQGVIKFSARFVGEATDEQGNVIGSLVATSTEDLTELSLVGGP